RPSTLTTLQPDLYSQSAEVPAPRPLEKQKIPGGPVDCAETSPTIRQLPLDLLVLECRFMELPRRARGDELLRPVELTALRRRPLVIAGGPHAVYQPYELFSANPDDPVSADVAVTGEEFVLLSLLEVLLSVRSGAESMRSAFFRARDSGALEDIPGLVYGRGG